MDNFEVVYDKQDNPTDLDHRMVIIQYMSDFNIFQVSQNCKVRTLAKCSKVFTEIVFKYVVQTKTDLNSMLCCNPLQNEICKTTCKLKPVKTEKTHTVFSEKF